MSDHFDYMPKPEGWRPPEPVVQEVVEDTPATELSDSSVKGSNASPVEDIPDTPLEHAITRFANVLSWVFVPLLMPVYGMILIFSLSILSLADFHIKMVFTLTVFVANFMVPMILVLLLKKMGLIQDVGLNGRKERLIPYIISIFCLGGTGFFLFMKGAPLWVAMFYWGGALAALINMIVNFRWKISAHAAGIAGIVAMLVQIMKEGVPTTSMTWWIVGAIIVSGLLGSARIWLGRHTLLQVLVGTLVGFLSVWALSLV